MACMWVSEAILWRRSFFFFNGVTTMGAVPVTLASPLSLDASTRDFDVTTAVHVVI